MISEYDQDYEKELRRHVRYHLAEEQHHREKRQELEGKLRTILQGRAAQRVKAGCPPAFALDCVLKDGTTCPFYHEGHCTKAQEAGQQ